MESARCKAFVAAVDTGSFTGAAELLNYTPSGVSQLVAALEKELNLTLLYRTRKGVSLTTAGETILPAARGLLQQEAHIAQLAAQLNGLSIGSITIGTYPSMAAHWLPQVIRSFQQDHPRIELHVREGTRQEITRWLEEGVIDLGFLSGTRDLRFEWLPLAEDRIVAILPKEHPLAASDTYPLHRCVEERLIMPSGGQDEDITAMFEENVLAPRVYLSTVEGTSVLALVESGLGMSIMNELVTRGHQRDVVKLPLDPPQRITLGIALPSLEEAAPATRKFVECAVKSLTKKENKEQRL